MHARHIELLLSLHAPAGAEEKKLDAMSKSESDAFMGEYFAFTEGIQKSGHYLAS